MSTSGALASCYADAAMGPESEDGVYGARFMQPPHMVTPRPAGGGDDADFASCNFAPKSAVFPSSWSSVHPQGIYHPYVHHHHHHHHPHHQAHLSASDGRYVGVRPWMDPLSNHHVSFAGLHSGDRPYGTIKADKAGGQCEPLEAEARPLRTGDEYACGASVVDCPDKASGERSGSELSSPGEHKEEKQQQQQQQQQLDPSEYRTKRIAGA